MKFPLCEVGTKTIELNESACSIEEKECIYGAVMNLQIVLE